MTRKQHRRWKKQNLESKKEMELAAIERPDWADDDKEKASFESWRVNFIAEIKAAIQVKLKTT